MTAWPRTTFFGLTIPKAGVQDFAPTLLESLSDAVEVVGLDVRLPVTPASVVVSGVLLKLTGPEDADEAGVGERVSAVAAYVAGGRVLASLIGVVSASVAADPGDGVVPGAVFAPAGSEDAEPVVADQSRSASQLGGFVVDGSSILFDGTEPLMIHDAAVAADAIADEDSGTSSRPVTTYDPTDKLVRSRVTIGAPGEMITLWFPVWIPADFGSFYPGVGAPVFSVRYKATGAGSVTMTFIDSLGVSHAAAPESGDTAYTEVMIGYGTVSVATVTPLTLCWVTVLIEGSVTNVIDVENMLRIRYQKRGQF